MQTILVVFHLFLAIGLIGLILIQHGKGADMGAAFGSGASGTVFGSKGSASFLTRLTAVLATLFFITSMVMAYFASQRDEGSVIFDTLQPPAVEQTDSQPQGVPSPQSEDVAVPMASESESEGVVPPAATVEEPAPVEAAVPAAEAPEGSDPVPNAEQMPAEEKSEAAPTNPVDNKE
jgi:preprotein translocase subunit SecG